MPRYRVKTHLTHDDRVFQPGDSIELSEEKAAAMPWAVEPATGAPPSSSEIAEAKEGEALAQQEEHHEHHEHHRRKKG